MDDEDAVLRSHTRILHGLGYQVRDATSGRAALAAEIVRLRPEVPVVPCGGLPRGAAESPGVRAFLLKPFSLGRLARTIRRVLDPDMSAEAKNASARAET